MSKTVIGVFSDRSKAEEVVRALEDQGFNEKEVSLLAKGEEGAKGGENLANGAGWGTGLGATAGLLAGIGALAIPGFGPVIAAGPIAATITGAATGGLAGGLLDYGIPDSTGRRLEQDIKRGEAVAFVKAGDRKAEKAADILKKHGAKDVEIH